MKKYLLFAGDHYYPTGFEDYKDAFDSIEEARAAGQTTRPSGSYCYEPGNEWASIYVYDWWAVVEHATMQVVDQGSNDR